MNILIIARGIPTKNNPVWGNFEFEQAESIAKLGHNVAVAAIDGRTRLYKRKIGVSIGRVNNIETYSIFVPLPYILIPVRLRTFLLQKIAGFLYRKIEKSFGVPDIIHAHYLPNIAIAVYLSKKIGCYVVGTEHWSKLDKEVLPYDVKYLGGKYYKKLDRLIAVSRSLSISIKKNFGVKSFVIDNMCATDIFRSNLKKTSNENNTSFTFVVIGRLIYRKGYDVLIDAFNRANFDKSVFIKIIGVGPLTDVLRKRIKKLGLENNIKLLGQKTKVEIADIMRDSDAFILTSRSETFGVVYIEAMAAGLPVIATPVGATRDFVNIDTGVIVDLENVQQIVQAMKNIYKNIDKYDSAQISNFIKDKYSPEVIAEKINNIYKELFIKQ